MCDASYRSKLTDRIARPRWGLLYGIVLVPVAAGIASQLVPLSATARTAVGTGLALGGLVAAALWVRANRAALDLQAWCECAASTMTVRETPSRRPEPDPVRRPAVADLPPAQDDEEALTVTTAAR